MANNTQLAVVMPVYNEQEIIEEVINHWIVELSQLSIDFKIHTYNDGSKDDTLDVLNKLALEDSRLVVHDKKNSGHGSTLVQAYRENSDAEWIFQVDSDNEMGPEGFKFLWENKERYQLLLGWRGNRHQPPARKIMSVISRIVVRIFYGRNFIDVNAPYRLMKSEYLKDVFFDLPENLFCPNVVISGVSALKGLDIYETVVLSRVRATGELSLRKFKLIQAALISFFQTIEFRFRNKYKRISIKTMSLEKVL